MGSSNPVDTVLNVGTAGLYGQAKGINEKVIKPATGFIEDATVGPYKEAKKAGEKAEAERIRVREQEKKKKLLFDTEIAAEKKKANDKALERMRRTGYAGTVVGGSPSATLLGSVG